MILWTSWQSSTDWHRQTVNHTVGIGNNFALHSIPLKILTNHVGCVKLHISIDNLFQTYFKAILRRLSMPSSALLQPVHLQSLCCFKARRCILARADVSDAANRERVWPIPSNSAATAQEARAAVQRAWKAGIKRQRIELLLPLIGATDLDDW